MHTFGTSWYARLISRQSVADGIELPWARRSTVQIGVAAFVCLLVGAAMSGWYQSSSVRRVEVSAPSGQAVQLSLPDDSRVMLGPGSTLWYSSGMTETIERDVRLEGEAYFDVAPGGRRPLRVEAGGLSAAIQAQAVVRAYPEDARAHVAVRKGQAEIAGTMVGTGEVGWMARTNTPVVVPADTSAWFAWTYGRLAFVDTFRNVIPRLSRWYDLDLQIADSALGSAVLVATLPGTMREGTLESLATALSARLERHGRRVIFHATKPGIRR